jgi:hypothetical protein
MKTHILFSVTFSENRTVYEIMSKNIVETEKPQMTSQCGAYALRARLARLYARMRTHTPTRPYTHMHARTHAQASTLRTISNTYCFPHQQWFCERASMLRYMYTVCLVKILYVHEALQVWQLMDNRSLLCSVTLCV